MSDTFAALRLPVFRTFMVAMSATFVATQVQSAVLFWQVYELSGDPLALGLVGLAEALPFLALTLLGGWAADHLPRVRLALGSLLLVASSGGALWALSLSGNRAVWPLYAAQAVAGVGRAFFRPATAALGAELVPRELLHNAATWRSSIFHATMVVGPALGGGLIALGGPRMAYAVVLGLSSLGLVAFLTLEAPRRERPASLGVIASLLDGVRFVWSQPVLLGAMSLDLFAVLFGGQVALLPVFAKDVLHVDEVGFGFLRAAPAVGSVLMSLVLARVGQFAKAGRALLGCVALFGVSWMLFALSTSYALSLALLVAGGALDSVSVVLRSTLVQLRTPAEKMGRVSAVNSFFIGSSNELGAFESGVAARAFGLVPSVLLGGALTLVTVGVVAAVAPSLRRLERLAGDEAAG